MRKHHFKNGVNPQKVALDKETLVELYDKRSTMSEIAEKLNTTKRVVHLRMQEYKIPRRKMVGQNHGSWKGGKVKKTGYWAIWNPSHPHANNAGYVKEHILVLEQILGRHILASEYIHHINFDRLDNRPENLWLTANHTQHAKAHTSLFKLAKPLLELGIIRFEKGEYLLGNAVTTNVITFLGSKLQASICEKELTP